MKNVNVAEFQSAVIAFPFAQKQPLMAAEFTLSQNSKQPECTLTNREMTILKCLSDGKSSIEIAKELFISHYTVRTHRKNIMKKVKAKNVAHLIQIALMNGWLAQ
jgi:DNA-binding CsgD family transcriptional regulator